MQKKATGPIFVIFGGVFNLAASQEGGVYRGTHVQVAPYPKEHRKRDDYERVVRTALAQGAGCDRERRHSCRRSSPGLQGVHFLAWKLGAQCGWEWRCARVFNGDRNVAAS